MNPVGYRPQSKRLLELVREVLRYRHYSLKTEQAYLYWIRFFVRWQSRDAPVEAMRHPRDMGAAEVTQFLTMLATERHVSASTHNQALSALLFLYREVLAIDLPWLNDFQRPTYKQDNVRAICKGSCAAKYHAGGEPCFSYRQTQRTTSGERIGGHTYSIRSMGRPPLGSMRARSERGRVRAHGCFEWWATTSRPSVPLESR